MGVRVETTNEKFFTEISDLNRFFASSPDILSNEGFISDTFVIMKNFLLSNPDNTTAKLLFDSAKNLYKQFGEKANLYLRLVHYLSTNVIEGEVDQIKARQTLRGFYDETHLRTLKFDAYGAFLEQGFSKEILDAILEANGGVLRIEKSTERDKDFVSKEAGFVFHVAKHAEFSSKNGKILILDKNYGPQVIAHFAQQCLGYPILVICLGHSKELEQFASLNENPMFHLVEALPEYKDSDFLDDLKHYTNYSLTLKPDSVGSDDAGSYEKVTLTGDTMRIYSKDSYVRKLFAKTLIKREVAESSPLIKQLYQKRLDNLIGECTVLNLCEGSELEKERKLQRYITEVLDISNIIIGGMVTECSLGRDFTGVSFEAFKTCYTKAAADLVYAMSPTRVIEQ